ncbi:hypothetical protein QJU96_10750, partial [Pasteurella skyensis]|uniref:hypothetical protein n=1 Tax=Phocoenobacter skyensis TaxID=97481 RepID=UPI00279050EF
LGNVLTSANLADRLLITGSNVGSDDNKVKLGKNVGKDEITGETTQLVQEKAVKSYVDGKAVQLGAQVKTVLDTKLDADDITSKDKTVTIDTTTTAGKVDLKVNLDGTTLTKDGNGVISLADNAVTTAKILDGNVTKAKLAGDVTNILDKVGTGAVADGNTNTVTGDVVKTYVDTATAGK